MQSRFFLFVSCLAFPALAAAQAVPDAGRISRESREREAREARPSGDPVLRTAETPPAGEAANGTVVAVRQVRVTGNTLVAAADLEAELQGLVGRSVGLAELQAAAGRLTSLYQARGYLFSRAYLPPQDVTDGAVTFAVLEGRIGEVKVNAQSGARLRAELAQNLLAPAQARGPAVRDADLERGLLLLSEYAGVRSSAVLEPADEVGAARVVLDLLAAPLVEGFVEIDNHGSVSTGEWRFGGEARLNGAFGRGESIHLSGLWTDGSGVRSGGLGFTFPLVPAWTLRGGFNRLDYEVGDAFAALDVNGRVTDLTLGASWAMARTRKLRVTAAVDFVHRELEDRIGAFNTRNDRSVDSLTLRVFGQRSDTLGAGGSTGFSASVTLGDLSLDSALQRAIDQGPGGYDTEGSFSRLNLAAWRTQYLGDAFSVHAAVRAQAALSGNLDSSEKDLLGGPRGVRGFPIAEAAGDQTLLGTLEVRHDARILPIPVQVFAFLDAGSVRTHKDPLPIDTDNSRSLSAFGLGARLNPTPNSQISATLARGDKDSLEDPTAGRNRFFVSASVSF